MPLDMTASPADVRLTAPDGYRAQRSYSIASSPLDRGEVELTIDRLDEGEVSGYFHDVVVEGDQVEVRGPFASYFVWRGEAPALLLRLVVGFGVFHNLITAAKETAWRRTWTGTATLKVL